LLSLARYGCNKERNGMMRGMTGKGWRAWSTLLRDCFIFGGDGHNG